MKKYNKWIMSMRMKYGNEYDLPLFSRPTRQESAPSPAPVINDATEEKAEVYANIDNRTITEQRKIVLDLLKRFGAATDNQIARQLGIHPSTVSARRNELRDLGLVVPVLDEYGRKVKVKDKITNTPNTLWRAI